MDISICIILGNREFYRILPSNQTISVGADPANTIQVPGCAISFTVKVTSARHALFSIRSDQNNRTISAECDIPVIIDEEGDLTALFSVADGKAICVPLDGEQINIGRSRKIFNDGHSNAVILDLPYVGRRHFRIEKKNGTFRVTDLNSLNGLYLNGKRISEATLKNHDVLSIYTVRMLFLDGALYFENVCGHLSQSKQSRSVPQRTEAQKLGNTAQDSFVRAPRLISGYETATIQIEKQPDPGGKPQFNWLSILVTPLISVALMVTLVLALGMSPVMLVMSGVMSVLSAVIAVFTYRKQKKEHLMKDELIETKYHEYLDSVRKKLEDAHQQQLTALTSANPSPADCLQIAGIRRRTLWERKPSDDDFVSARIGTGTIPTVYQASFQQSQIVLQERELEQEAAQIAEDSTTITDAPIIGNFLSSRHTGVVGERAAELQLVRNILVELATSHSADELKIVVVFPEKERAEWDWVRWLPHCSDAAGRNRFCFCSFEEAESSLEEIGDVLSRRKADDDSFSESRPEDLTPHYFFVFAEYPWAERHPIRKLLFSGDNLGCSGLFVYDRLSVLPKDCSQIIELKGQNGELFHRSNSLDRARFTMDELSVELADSFARSLAPLRSESGSGSADLPSSISFLEGYQVSRPEQLQIGKRWAAAQTYQTLSVPIASRGGKDLFEFDIHEKHHGVNGIVAGMPGSGKTEMVQSWLLSLAVNYSPQDLSFVLIDFKGTGMIAPFRDMPHLAGAISNLDTNIDRNLKAIQSEVHRREAIIDRYSVKSVKNVNDLNKAYAKGLVPEKLPILLIVIDEYAEFKKIFPDFGAEIDSLTSKGRALGIFVILMTQKPAGVVSAKSEDNIKFRWCLRVANYGASREMLGRPDAARITNPGRCFVKVGEDEVYEEVQSFWSGAPYRPSEGEKKKAFVPICTVARNGAKKPCEQQERKKTVETNLTEIDVVARYITAYCRENGIPNADQVWMPRLPDRMALTDVLENAFDGQRWPEKAFLAPIIGLADEPEKQRQFPMALDFPQCGSTLIYGAPVTGKTTLLQTLVMSLAMSRKPDEASIYIMDFGGWNMSVFRDFPHVGGIANDDAPERLKKLMLLISDTLQIRKALFSGAGVGNVTAYRKTNAEKLPDVFLIVDNLSVLLKMYPDADAFFINLSGSGANYGVYLIATAQSANSIPMKISQNIKNTIALQMIDKSDYTYLVGKVKDPLPQIAGRGLSKGNPPLEFQTALPGPGTEETTITNFIRKAGRVMCDAWNGKRAEPIPEMPEVIPYGSVPAEKAALGLTSDRIQPVEYDWEKQHYLLISGTPQSGKSSLLYTVAKEMKDRMGGRVCLLDVKRSAQERAVSCFDVCLSQARQIDDFIERMRPELQRRQAEKLEDSSTRFDPLILAIDDYSEFFAAVSNDTISRLLAIVKLGHGLDLYLIAAGAAYEISSLFNKGEAVLISIGKAKQAVMLGGCMNDHGAVPSNASYSIKNIKVGASEGYFVRDSEPTRFKAICFTKEA